MNAEQKATALPKKGKGKKWFAIGLGVLGTGALSYFGWQYYKKKKEASANEDGAEETPLIEEGNSSPDEFIPKQEESTANDFPLQKGSKGANVKLLQQALIKKYGKSILPQYGADGDFGSEMVSALKKVGLPDTITETTFNVLVKGSTGDPAKTAQQIYTAIGKMDFNTILSILKTLRNTTDYKAVNDVFKSGNYLVQGVHQTLVNALLTTFPDDRLKQMLGVAFSNIGLKYDGNKWALSGIDNAKTLITIAPAKVWKTPQVSVSVPANTVLGKEIAKRGNYTMFENDSQLFLVQSQQIKYYKQQ